MNQPSGFASEHIQSQDDTILSGFTDSNVCGEGASCRVYRMRRAGLRVAVKRLRPELLTNPAYVASYRKEFCLGQQLKHDGLPVYREMRDDTDEVYIVMDFIDGIALSDFLDSDQGRIFFSSAANVRRFLAQILDVTGYLHRSGVIHCDIKPANIMLRHTDRGVMLLDLDKAYSDSLDLTHGGSPRMSDPLAAGRKPTAQKDFSAIGHLIDYIDELTPQFPRRRFRRFRKECSDGSAAYESLVKALDSRGAGRWSIITVAACGILAAIGYFIARPEPAPETEPAPDERASDTITIIRQINDSAIAPPAPPPAAPKFTAADLDRRMEGFISEAEGALASLQRGTLTDREIREMMTALIESHTSHYQALLTAYRAEHPEMAGIDVELAAARASENSRATRLWHQFNQAAADTLEERRSRRGADHQTMTSMSVSPPSLAPQ